MTIINKVSNKTLMPGITPIPDVPDAPTIGTATATGSDTATVTFTAAVTGGTVTTFTATSTPGSITGTSATSPITISGLTGSTSYTFKVKGTNATATGPESSASNSITTDAPNSFESIATFDVSTPTSTITFSSIPQTFKHLQLRHIARTTNVSTNGNMYIQINGDTGNNYSYHRLEGYNTGTSSAGVASAAGFGIAGLMTGSQSITSSYGAGVLEILDYTNTNKYKTLKTLTGYDNNGNGASGNDQGYVNFNSGMWFKAGSGVTSDAINSITITINAGGNFAQYSTFALYGIKG